MLSSRRLVGICALMLCCNIAIMVFYVKYNIGEKCYLQIEEQNEAVAEIPDSFLSIGIDASEIANNAVNFTHPRLRELAAALAPCHLRLGGTMSDRLIFSKEDVGTVSCEDCHKKHSKHICGPVKKMCKHKFLPFFIMTGSKWSEVNEFCKVTGTKLLFAFNVLLRNENGWSEQNAKELLAYSKSKKYQIDWQLGNEPNSFRHTFNITVKPKDLAHDFKKLRHLLNELEYKDSLLVGPDTTRPQPERPECLTYMLEFLGNASHVLNVRSWHQYYLNSRTAKLDDFWKPSTFKLLEEQIDVMAKHTKNYTNIPMWLSETSSSYGGGAPGLSDSFAGTPLFLDKLGLCAKHNITTIIRQSFYGGNYSLVDKNLNPLPDWWVSVLYKKIVGNKVLSLKCNCSPNQRMYIHCANRNYTNDTSAITIYGLNLEKKTIKFLLNGTAIQGENLHIDEFVISAPSNNRYSKTVLLNGWPLYYEYPLPDLSPRHLRYGNHISIPPYSVGFWVVRNTTLELCK